MFLIDTNVLIHAANPSGPEHSECRRLLESARRSLAPWHTTWAILYEFLRVITHPRIFPKPWRAPDAWRFVSALLASRGLQVLVETPRHGEVADQVLKELPALHGTILHDAHTAILMREHGIRRIYTRDTDFHRFRFLEVVDPLARGDHSP